MNLIEAKPYKIDYYEGLQYRIDNQYWLDEWLTEITQNEFYTGLMPTMVLDWMSHKEEKEIVRQRIYPPQGIVTNCPILMCPDDLDFACTIIIAEIVTWKDKVTWNRIGIDQSDYVWEEPYKIGTTVNWFEEVPTLTFSCWNYLNMLYSFMEKYLPKRKGFEPQEPFFFEL